MIAAWAPAVLVLAGRFAWPGAMAVDGRALGDPDRPARPAAVVRFVERYGLPAAAAAVGPLLDDRDSGVRFVAARLLVRAGDAAAIATATRWITEPGRPAGDRAAGLEALARAPAFTPPIRAAFEQAIRDRDPAIRVQALAALGRQDAVPSLPAIIRALDDDARDVRLGAAVLIGGVARVDPAAAARAALPLLERLDDPDHAVRLAALRALGSLHDPRTVPALLRLAGDEPNVIGAAAADALGSPAMAAATADLAALARAAPVDETARQALLALGEIATPPAVAALID
ncbi:MAG TPA: HEAT repeat domain-containing protein, partial [Polyangia bacterium]|nr:HEAT repeat domain-containing protein [Polyangia bacterium]